MNKPVTYTLGGLGALAVSLWQLWPAFDAVIFTQAEASDVAQVQRQLNYEDKEAIAELKLKHEIEAHEVKALEAEIEYYRERLRELKEVDKK